MTNLHDTILNQIKTGDLDMKPKWHFVLRAGLLLSGVVLVLLLSVYFLSFVFFFLRQTGLIWAPGFGLQGLGFLVLSTPWLLLGTSCVFLGVLYVLVTKYSFSYRQPLLYSMGAVVVLALVGSWFFVQSPAHERISAYAEHRALPVIAPLYQSATPGRAKGATVGVITTLTDTGFTMTSARSSGTVDVTLTERTRQKPGIEPAVGDWYIVFGNQADTTITAIGIRPFDRERIRTDRLLREQPPKNERPPRELRNQPPRVVPTN